MRSPLARLRDLDEQAHKTLAHVQVTHHETAEEISRTLSVARRAMACVGVLAFVAACLLMTDLIESIVGDAG